MQNGAARHTAGTLAAAALVLVASAGCARRPATPPDTAAAPPAASRLEAEARRHAVRPLTRAERSRFTETSRHADVLAFLDTLRQLGAPIVLDTLGRTVEGRAIPLVLAARPRVATLAAARALGRPIVYLQANIHAGEVEGKEAVQMLLRDLALEPGPNVLDSLVLVAVPIYNADGNERLLPQGRQRTEQQGPELVGQRPNAEGLDLNRDYVKAEAPETRAALAFLARWDPDVFVDLHTTNGSYHGYRLTWSPSLHPAAALRAFNQDTLLPLLAERLERRRGVATFPYGNFSTEYGADVTPDTTKQGWFTYDHRPRFGTNYYGLRGRLSVLGEAYSHDPFERRVRSTYAFVAELLSLVAEAGADVRARATRFRAVGDTVGVLRARLTERPVRRAVVAEDLAVDPDSVPDEPGVPRGLRRTGRYRTLVLPVHDRFVATRTRALPAGGWVLAPDAPGAAAAVRLLRLHGVRVERLGQGVASEVERFRIDDVVRAARAFQGHREVLVEGTWSRARERLAAGSHRIPADQPLALLAFHLLEPEGDDGLTTWNVFDAGLAVGATHPVRRLSARPAAPGTPLP